MRACPWRQSWSRRSSCAAGSGASSTCCSCSPLSSSPTSPRECSPIRTGTRRREGSSFRHCPCSVTRCSSRLGPSARRSHPGDPVVRGRQAAAPERPRVRARGRDRRSGDDGRDRLLHRDRLRCDAACERPLDQRRRRRGGGVATAGRLVRVDPVRGWLARGAALLAAAILPLSTAYSVSEALGREARVEASIREEPVFYGTYALVVGVGALVVLVPGAPLVPILFITQAINAVLLLPLLAFIALLTRDRSLMGQYATGRAWTVVIVAVTLMIAAATIVLGVVLVGG